MSKVDFTVAIPTYNGEHRLPELLEKLRAQVQTEPFSWEVIVVDNNSRDQTAKVVRSYQDDFPCPLRYCFERRQGVAYARKRAIQESQGELVGFLDDDNLPISTWVAAAYAFAQAYPMAGAYGSQIHGDFEVEPPESLRKLIPFLAITERGSKPLKYEPSQKLLPPAAGLVVRKQAWIESVPERIILCGRVDKNMVCGDDLEAILHIQHAGWEVWYNPAMEMQHKIPTWRLEREYLLPFFRGVGLSRHVTRMLSFKPWQRPIAFLAYFANDSRKVLLHLAKHRFQVKSDLVAACEMELFISSLFSAFYLWKNGYLHYREANFLTANPSPRSIQS